MDQFANHAHTVARLAASEVRYRRLFESAKDGILILDAETGNILDANPFLLNLLGYEQKEILGRRIWEIGPLKDVAASEAAFSDLQSKEYIRYEHLPLESKDGRRIAAEFVSNVYIEGPGRVIQCNIRDISERERAQDSLSRTMSMLKSTINSSPDLIYVKDQNLRTILCNEAFARAVGRTPEEVYGKTDLESGWGPQPVHGGSGKGVRLYEQDDRDALAGKIIHIPAEPGRAANGDGNIRLYDTIKLPLRADNGEVIGVLGISRDVTEYRQLEERLQESQRMEVVGRLAGGIAHDFNNILQAILGFSEILLDNLETQDTRRRDVREIHTAAERAAVLTRQLLAFSRRQVIAPRVINANVVLGSLERMLERMIGEDVRIVTNLAPDLKRIRADAGQIEQIVMNLAINARDAMPKGGRLTIGTSNVTLEDQDTGMFSKGRRGQFVCITVTDTGTGMSPDVLRHAFEPFFTTKGLGKGTGLGLAAVYGIAGQHEGWVDAYSEPDQGSAFKIYLPVCPDEEALEDSAQPGLQQVALGHGERILIVEDESSIRTLSARVLRDKGYQVSVAGKAQEALTTFRNENGQFDLIFSDVVLPDQSGLELVETIHAQKPELPILLCSGYTDERSRWDSIFEKGFHYLQKPYPLAVLLNTVQAILSAPPAGPASCADGPSQPT